MTSSPTQTLRRFVRIPFHADVQLTVRDLTFSVNLVDIALKGALVQADRPHSCQLYDRCRLLLPLADDGDGIVMMGEIVHIEGPMIGLKCVDIDVVSLTRLRRLVELNAGDPDLMDRELRLLFCPD